MVAYHVALVVIQHDSDQSTGFGGTKNTFVANFKRSSYCCVGGRRVARKENMLQKYFLDVLYIPMLLFHVKSYASWDVQNIQKILLQHIFRIYEKWQQRNVSESLTFSAHGSHHFNYQFEYVVRFRYQNNPIPMILKQRNWNLEIVNCLVHPHTSTPPSD